MHFPPRVARISTCPFIQELRSDLQTIQREQQRESMDRTASTSGNYNPTNSNSRSTNNAVEASPNERSQLTRAMTKQEAEQETKDIELAQLLEMMVDWKPIIPDEVIDYYLQKSGFETDDLRVFVLHSSTHPLSLSPFPTALTRLPSYPSYRKLTRIRHIQEKIIVPRSATLRLFNLRRRFPVRPHEDDSCSWSHCERKGDGFRKRQSRSFPFFSPTFAQLPSAPPLYAGAQSKTITVARRMKADDLFERRTRRRRFSRRRTSVLR